MTDETWKDIVSHPGIYQVSDYGRVKRIARGHGARVGRILKPSVDRDGYLRVGLRNGRNSFVSTKLIHRLVLESFVGLCPSGQITRHLDGNRSNNYLSNLRWGSYVENEKDKIDHGTKAYGSKIGTSILFEAQVRNIKRLLADGFTHRCIAGLFDVSHTTIGDIARGKWWRHIA